MSSWNLNIVNGPNIVKTGMKILLKLSLSKEQSSNTRYATSNDRHIVNDWVLPSMSEVSLLAHFHKFYKFSQYSIKFMVIF